MMHTDIDIKFIILKINEKYLNHLMNLNQNLNKIIVKIQVKSNFFLLEVKLLRVCFNLFEVQLDF